MLLKFLSKHGLRLYTFRGQISRPIDQSARLKRKPLIGSNVVQRNVVIGSSFLIRIEFTKYRIDLYISEFAAANHAVVACKMFHYLIIKRSWIWKNRWHRRIYRSSKCTYNIVNYNVKCKRQITNIADASIHLKIP